VTRTAEELRAAITAAEAMPYGTARSAVLERIVAESDTLGDEETGARARLSLITAYCYGGEPLKRFTPFAWVLARHDERPSWFDADMRHSLLWYFKWVTVGMLAHPAVPLERIEDGLADMADRYAAAGEGNAPYLGCRFVVTQHVHGAEAAHEDYLSWVRAPRTALSDCRACEPTARAEHLNRLSRFDDVVREAEPVLANGGCAEQPQSMISVALEALLRTGRVEQAAREHLRGTRIQRTDPSATRMHSRHIFVCARSGRLLRGLDLLEERLHEIEAPPSPEEGMWLAAAGARLLRGLDEAGRGDLEVSGRQASGGQPTATSCADLLDRLTDAARTTAALFDTRNGTAAVGTRVERWLDASPLPDLPVDAVQVRRRPGGRPVAVPHRSAADRSGPDAVGPGQPVPRLDAVSSLADLTAALAASGTTGVPTERARVITAWRAARDRYLDLPPDHPDAAETARLEAALALDTLRETLDDDPADAEQAVDTACRAAERLRAVGEPGAAALHEQLCLAERARASLDGTVPLPLDGVTRLVRRSGTLTDEVERFGSRAEAGCAHLRHYGLLRWLGERRRTPDRPDGGPGTPADPAVEDGWIEPGLAAEAAVALERGLAAFEAAASELLTGYQRACWAMLLMARGEGLDEDHRVAALRAAMEVLPAGTRRGERAVIGRELGGALAGAGAPVDAAEALGQAAEDAAAAEDTRLLASTLSQLGVLRRHLGLQAEAVDALTRAVPLWERLDEPHLADRARFDLAWALVDDDRPLEAAEVAESALAAVEATLAEDDPAPGDSPAGSPAPGGSPPAGAPPSAEDRARPAVTAIAAQRAVLAGMLAYCAATAARDIGDEAYAATLAERSACWHQRAGNGLARAESLQLAAECQSDRASATDQYALAATLYRESGEVLRSLTCLRARAMAVVHADGLAAARLALTEISAVLDAAVEAAAERDDERERLALEWHRVALADQTVRVLATGGATEEALRTVEGIAGRYRELGDAWSARDVTGLRGLLLEELGRVEEALDELRASAEEALDAGDTEQMRSLGTQLAAALDELGRPDQADAAWSRYSHR